MKKILLALLIVLSGKLAVSQEVQTITLKKGWNIVSSYIVPNNTDLDAIFNDVPLQVLLSMDGIYYPDQNVKTLTSWNPHSAFKIKMKQDATIQISGSPVTGNNMVNLPQGVSYLPVLTDHPVTIEEIFGSNISEVILIVDMETMDLYAPYIGIIGFLEYLNPGKGYLVIMNNPVPVTF